MRVESVAFSLAGQAAWAPGVTTPERWAAWAQDPWPISAADESEDAPARAIPPMLRRRAGSLGKMALHAASEALAGHTQVPAVFCSRHGEVGRAIALLDELAAGAPLSPTAFGLSVHNAIAGLLSIARTERANQIALSAGAATVEHGVIEACGLLADGAPLVLLVVYDAPLPDMLRHFEDCDEQPFAFAWLMAPASAGPALRLSWRAAPQADNAPAGLPGGLAALRFQLSGARSMQRRAGAHDWLWCRDA